MALYKYVKADPKPPKQSIFSRIKLSFTIRVPEFGLPQISMPTLTIPKISLPTPRRKQQPAYAYATEPAPARPKRKRSKAARLASLSLGLTGLLLIGWVGYPIVSFEIKSRTKFAQTVEPVPPSANVLGWEQVTKLNDQTESVEIAHAADTAPSAGSPQVQAATSDINSVSNWLPKRQQRGVNTAGRIYYLSIPELDIEDAKVKIAGEDLDTSLIHYGGTGLPGEYGSSVIFGHSILPQFYDPTNYKAIFSMLPNLDEGDHIQLKYDGITYTYEIFSMRVTSPDDISVLEQRYDASYVTLITCVPPGTYWKRLEVKGRLIPA